MTCDEAKNLIAIGVFGEPDPADTAALKDHLKRCPSCARAAERSAACRRSFDVPDDLRMPDWDRSWEIIARRSFRDRKIFRIFGLPGTWAIAAAALLAVFVLGVVVGRRVLRPLPEPILAGAVVPREASPLLGYADSLDPILTDFLNRGPAGFPPEMSDLRKTVFRSMLEETRRYKGLAEKLKDAELGNFLDELEVVLVSLSHLDPGDRASADLLDRTIRDHHMRSKLRELSGLNVLL